MRETNDFNLDWKFSLGDISEASEPQFDDSQWRGLDLPHDWSIEGAHDKDIVGGRSRAFLPGGVGWYRKTFPAPLLEDGQRAFIDLEGVYMNADVWINGVHLGFRNNGYVGQQYELTGHLRDGENVVCVRCDCSSLPNCRWYPGCGVHRPARLIVRDSLSIARHGLYIATPRISLENALVEVEATLENTGDAAVYARLEIDVFDAEGLAAVETKEMATWVESGDRQPVSRPIELPRPRLWSPHRPYVYRVEARVYDDAGQLRDMLSAPLGLRTIEFSPERGFLLNGEKTIIKGVDLHHDLGSLGAKAFDQAIERRLRAVKEMGCNAVRLAHNPHAPYVIECCDKMGLLVFDEAFDSWKGYASENKTKLSDFGETWERDLGDLILRDRNHPSVFIWSVGNETPQQRLQMDEDVHGSKLAEPDYGVARLRKMIALCHRLDPSRKATCALFPARRDGHRIQQDGFFDAEPAQMAFNMDVVSGNYLQKFYPGDHARYPQMAFLATEVTTAGGARAWFTFDHEYVGGMFYWGGTDYLGESTLGYPLKGWATGLIDMCDRLKPFGYYAKAMYSDEPVLHISVHDTFSKSDLKHPKAVQFEWNDVTLERSIIESHWNWPEGASLKLATYTNCDAIELLLNGKSLGVKRLADCERKLIEWEGVAYEPGEIVAVAFNDGKVVAEHQLETHADACALSLTCESSFIEADRSRIAYIGVEALDAAGRLDQSCSSLVEFTIDGPAEIIAVDNADMFSEELFVAEQRSFHQGRCQVVARSTGERGKVTLTARSVGLVEASLRLRAV